MVLDHGAFYHIIVVFFSECNMKEGWGLIRMLNINMMIIMMMMRMMVTILGLLLSECIDTVAKRKQRSVDGCPLLQTQSRVLINHNMIRQVIQNPSKSHTKVIQNPSKKYAVSNRILQTSVSGMGILTMSRVW